MVQFNYTSTIFSVHFTVTSCIRTYYGGECLDILYLSRDVRLILKTY